MLLPQVVSCSKSLPWIAPPPHGIIVEEQIRSAKTMTYFQDVHRFISVYHRKVKVYMFNTFYQPNPIIKQIKVPSPWSHEGSVFVPDSYWSLRWRQDTILSEGLKPFGQQTISKVKLQHQFSSLRVAHNTNQDTTGVLLSLGDRDLLLPFSRQRPGNIEKRLRWPCQQAQFVGGEGGHQEKERTHNSLSGNGFWQNQARIRLLHHLSINVVHVPKVTFLKPDLSHWNVMQCTT